jgi:hypothetical protein
MCIIPHRTLVVEVDEDEDEVEVGFEVGGGAPQRKHMQVRIQRDVILATTFGMSGECVVVCVYVFVCVFVAVCVFVCVCVFVAVCVFVGILVGICGTVSYNWSSLMLLHLFIHLFIHPPFIRPLFIIHLPLVFIQQALVQSLVQSLV